MLRITNILFFSLLSNIVIGQNIPEDHQKLAPKKSPELFIENNGQWPDEVLFLTRLGGLDAWITSKGITFDTYQLKKSSDENIQLNEDILAKSEENDLNRVGQIIRLNLVNCNTSPLAEGKMKGETYYNYFLGNDESKWQSRVSLYGEVVIEDIYADIDIRYYFDNSLNLIEDAKSMRYDFIIQPGASPSEIKLNFEGVESSNINAQGELVLNTRFGEMKQMDLFSYQMFDGIRKEVRSNFIKNVDGTIGFSLGDFDSNLPLIIDPLVYSTYIGGSMSDAVRGIAIDISGNAIITGNVQSANFPTTIGAYDQVYSASNDIFISKLNANGNNLIFSSFIGGNGNDFPSEIAIDAEGNSYITGKTNGLFNSDSNSYPFTLGAYSEFFNDELYRIFITKLNSTGTSLVYSTNIAGSLSNTNTANDIAVDVNQNVYITGYFTGQGFPTTPGAFDESYGNGNYSAAYVLKLNNTGSALMYSTYIDGGFNDAGESIDVDSYGNAYITGSTWSSDFPTTIGSYDQTYNGAMDAFVSKLNDLGTELIYSTFIGGSSGDFGMALKVDDNGNAFIVGDTYSVDYPSTNNVFDDTYNATTDVFITKLNPLGNNLVFSTFVGGSDIDNSHGLDIDYSGNVYICGATLSADFPTTIDGYDQTLNGNGTTFDAFIMAIDSIGNSLIYSSFLGSNNDDFARTIAVQNNDGVYLAGSLFGSGFPTTSGAYDQTSNGTFDGFITKFCIEPTVINADAFSNNPVCSGQNLELGVSAANGFLYSWTGPNGFASNEQYPIIPYSSSAMNGTYIVTITGNCTTKIDSVIVLVQPSPIVQAGANVTSIPVGGSIDFTNIGSNATSNLWNFGDGQSSNQGNVSHSYSTAGNFNVLLTGSLNGCTDSSWLTIVVGHAGVESLFEANNITLLPNPTDGYFTLEIDINKAEKIEISLYDLMGQQVFLDFLENYSGTSLSYDMSKEASGLYILTVKTENGNFNKRLEIAK